MSVCPLSIKNCTESIESLHQMLGLILELVFLFDRFFLDLNQEILDYIFYLGKVLFLKAALSSLVYVFKWVKTG